MDFCIAIEFLDLLHFEIRVHSDDTFFVHCVSLRSYHCLCRYDEGFHLSSILLTLALRILLKISWQCRPWLWYWYHDWRHNQSLLDSRSLLQLFGIFSPEEVIWLESLYWISYEEHLLNFNHKLCQISRCDVLQWSYCKVFVPHSKVRDGP